MARRNKSKNKYDYKAEKIASELYKLNLDIKRKKKKYDDLKKKFLEIIKEKIPFINCLHKVVIGRYNITFVNKYSCNDKKFVKNELEYDDELFNLIFEYIVKIRNANKMIGSDKSLDIKVNDKDIKIYTVVRGGNIVEILDKYNRGDLEKYFERKRILIKRR